VARPAATASLSADLVPEGPPGYTPCRKGSQLLSVKKPLSYLAFVRGNMYEKEISTAMKKKISVAFSPQANYSD
jgi:hypothetical protein